MIHTTGPYPGRYWREGKWHEHPGLYSIEVQNTTANMVLPEEALETTAWLLSLAVRKKREPKKRARKEMV